MTSKTTRCVKKWIWIFFIIIQAMQIHAATWYVTINGAGDGTSWTNAFSNIQNAISMCSSGHVVLVSNGVYNTGGVTNWPVNTILTNRIPITTEYVTVRSLNGTAATIIEGARDPGGDVYGRGPAAIRCVYMADNTSLLGFTVTNGATMIGSDDDTNSWGGGISCPRQTTLSMVISNCIITGNAARWGGGAFGGNFYDCIFSGNSATYGGAVKGYATTYHNPVLYNCLLADNSSISRGGAGHVVYGMYNCTIVGNTAGAEGGGLFLATNVYNSISWGNNTTDAGVTRHYSCGVGWTNASNITNDPQFVDFDGGNYRLKANSPCINTGTNQAWMTNANDLDGCRRIYYGTVDMGAYEKLYEGTIWSAR